MNIPFEKRPTCSCGVKMKLIEYKGYYEGFKYWECENCTLEDEIQSEETKADKVWGGSFC